MKTAILIVSLLCAVLVVGCNGDAGAGANEPESQDNTETTPESPSQEAAPTQPSTQAAQNDARDAFERALSGYGTNEFKVEYDITTTAQGETYSGTMAMYMKGVNKLRTDTEMMGMQTRTYMLEDSITSCFNFGSWSCTKYDNEEYEPSESEGTNPNDGLQDALEDDNSYTITRDGTMQVAGVTAECYLLVSDDGRVRYCIYDSVPLYNKVEAEDMTSEMRATSYSKRVADSDFVPPASSSDGGMQFPQGYQIPNY